MGNKLMIPCNIGKVSDGFHTFDELYEHRHRLFIALMLSNPELSWRSKKHSDGTMYEGWFVAGMHLPGGDISYHLPLSLWEEVNLVGGNISMPEYAPEWDGHTASDVLLRLREWTSNHR